MPGKGVIGSTSPRFMTDTEWDTGNKSQVMPFAQTTPAGCNAAHPLE